MNTQTRTYLDYLDFVFAEVSLLSPSDVIVFKNAIETGEDAFFESFVHAIPNAKNKDVLPISFRDGLQCCEYGSLLDEYEDLCEKKEKVTARLINKCYSRSGEKPYAPLIQKLENVLDKNRALVEVEEVSTEMNDLLYAQIDMLDKLFQMIPRRKATQKQEISKESIESRHFNIERLTESKLTEENARNLYHHLIAENWISRDVPENDFIYYFTADCGTEPTYRLHWNTNDSLLGLVLYRIVKNRIPWKKLDLIFDNLPPNMRQTVAQKKKSQYLDEALAKIDKWISSSD